jgi:TRAP-type uncharacterized transport system fused permease subunit
VALVSQTLISTGFGIKVAAIVEAVSGGNLVVALILTMLLSLVLGMGIPTVAAYALVAMVVAPVIVKMGVSTMAAHFFVLYMAVKSHITPPVAFGALAACGISGGNYWKTSVEAFRLGLSGLIIPFLFIFNPVIILQPLDPLQSTLSMVAVPLALVALTALVYDYFFYDLSWVTRIALVFAAAGLFGYGFTKSIALFSLGFLIFLSLFFWQRRQRSIKEQEVMSSTIPMEYEGRD